MSPKIEIVLQAPKRPAKARKPLKRTKPTLTKSSSTQRRIKPKKWKFKKTELQKHDAHFSEKIRTRDGKCLFPGCPITDIAKLQCSHYEGRARWETRFDEENCIALCWNHHYNDKQLGWEYQKQRTEKHGWDGKYTLFMKEWLGEERFNALLSKPKQSRKDVMEAYKNTYEPQS